MTPFDPYALLAMLLAFYPVVSVMNLIRARAERPDYFAGGTLFGSCGEKLRLPDGRVWDLIYDCGGPNARWQAIEPGPGGDGGGDGFELEPGPLTPLDETTAIPPLSDPSFEPLVTDSIGEVRTLEGLMGDAATTMTTDAAPGAIGDALDAALGEAQEGHWRGGQSLEGATVGDLVETTDGLNGQIDAGTGELPEPPENIPTTPTNTDPGPPPSGGDEPPDEGPPEA